MQLIDTLKVWEKKEERKAKWCSTSRGLIHSLLSAIRMHSTSPNFQGFYVLVPYISYKTVKSFLESFLSCNIVTNSQLQLTHNIKIWQTLRSDPFQACHVSFLFVQHMITKPMFSKGQCLFSLIFTSVKINANNCNNPPIANPNLWVKNGRGLYLPEHPTGCFPGSVPSVWWLRYLEWSHLVMTWYSVDSSVVTMEEKEKHRGFLIPSKNQCTLLLHPSAKTQ